MFTTFYLEHAAAVAAAGLACLALLREKRTLARNAFVAGLCVLAMEALCEGRALAAADGTSAAAWLRLRLLATSLLPAAWLTFSLVYARGNYLEFLRRWRLLLAAVGAVPLLTAAAGWQALAFAPAVPDPRAPYVNLGSVGTLLLMQHVVAFVLILMNLERTLLASTGTMRWRIKFIVLGVGLLFSMRVYVATQHLLYRSLNLALDSLSAGALLLSAVPLLKGMLRARFSEPDVYPSHATIYQSLTVMLAGVYLLAVGLLARIATHFGAVSAFPLKAFLLFAAIIALSAVMLSDRVRQSCKRFVSVHLRRSQYDYRRVWRQFTSGTASAMDTRPFCRAVAKQVSDTLEVLSVTVWLADEAAGALSFGESTSLSDERAHALLEGLREPAAAIRALRQVGAPLRLNREPAPWARGLQALCPCQFDDSDERLCIPLRAGGELLGVMLLADRVRGLPYSIEELDLLWTIGEQIAAHLLNIRLSERLLAAKQMEAFQTMSAFFVHDLKNTSSTLSLMLQNLPKHFNDPAFRADALAGIGQSVARIDALIRRLTKLRERLDIAPVPTDLNLLVQGALRELDGAWQMAVEPDFGVLPPVPVDPDQMQKVVMNLLLNARDASGGKGTVRVSTAQRPGWAVLAVTDYGAGMTADFIATSLFRPFKSTKKEGMGIGLFQSRMIVEAHRGRVEVDSEPGRGSTFRVMLPLPEE